MSVSSRDRRAAIYPYVGSSTDGYNTATYGASRGTFWCRVSPVPGDEFTVGAQAEHSQRCVLEFGDEATIDEDDLIVVDSVQWKVESGTLRRSLRRIIVHAFRTDDTPTYVTA